MQHFNARIAFALLCAVGSTTAAQGSPSDPRHARVTGRVADAVGTAIVKAEVRVTNTGARTETGDDGRFDLTGLPSGPIEVVVRRLGFAPATIALELGERELRDIRVLLAPVAMALDSVTVTAEPAPTVEKAYMGFEMRKSRGFGTFITREQIEKKNPRVTTDLFRSVAGVKLMRENGSPTVVSSRLGTLAYCPVRYYVDGTSYPLYGQSIDVMVQTMDIGAIEVYPGGATVPPQFGGREAACGVIAIWTLHGTKKQK